ncbi:hypothetical protein KRMM14A1004_22690 [Krasilnikovia sp. MM14-A1004]
MVAQYAFAAWYAACVYLALAQAAHLAGHWYLPSWGDTSTADVDVSGGWTWAAPVTITVAMAPLVAWVSLFVSSAVFLIRGASGSRRLTFALIGSSVLMLLVIVVTLTPPGIGLSGWLSD